jgi:outer membrane protein assembly factor BamA
VKILFLGPKVIFILLFLSTFFSKAQDVSENISGKKYYVKAIQIEGNKRTKNAIIIRELGINIGDSLSANTFEALLIRRKNNIFNTNLFNKVEVLHILTQDTLELKIKVEERWYFLGIPEILLADRSFNEWFYDRDKDFSRISYGINLKHFNLTGNNDQLKFKALGGFIPYYEVGYLKPYIDKRKRIGIRMSVFYSTQRTMAYRTWNDKLDFLKSEEINRKRLGGMFEIRLKNALYHFHALNLGFVRTSISDTIALRNENYLGIGNKKQNLFMFSYNYRFDQRDNRQYPLRGSYLDLTLNSFSAAKTTSVVSLSARYTHFFSLFKNTYLSVGGYSKISGPRDQVYTLMSGLGYAGTLVRGYELFVVDGQHFALQKSTLKYKAFDRTFDLSRYIRLSQFKTLPVAIYPNVFFDMGYVKNYFPERSNSKLGNKLLTGGGLGIDFVTWYSTNIKFYITKNSINQTGFFFGMSRDY